MVWPVDRGNMCRTVSDQLYLVILASLAVAGCLAGRWRLIAVVVALAAIGLAIAAFAGAFHKTSEDSSGWLFYFAAWATLLWILAFSIGTAAGRIIRWVVVHARRAHPDRGMSAPQ